MTVYQNIAKDALINWNELTEEEAIFKIQNESFLDLEKQVSATNSIKYAIIGLTDQVNLTNEEVIMFFDAIINGEKDTRIFETVNNKIGDLSSAQQLEILSVIHDGWVIENRSNEIYEKKLAKEQLRQYVPLELLGWNEVKSDLLFLKPILEAIGVFVDEEILQEEYYLKAREYMNNMNITNKNDLAMLISLGKKYYYILPEELETKLIPKSFIISDQIINNWNNNDKAMIEIVEGNNGMIQGTRRV